MGLHALNHPISCTCGIEITLTISNTGVIESGPGLAPGTPVFGLATGCLGSHVLSHRHTLAPLPPNLTFEVGREG